MIKVKDFVKLFKGDTWFIFSSKENSLFCSIEDAIKILENDRRGEVLVPLDSVEVYEQNIGYSGIHRKCVQINYR